MVARQELVHLAAVVAVALIMSVGLHCLILALLKLQLLARVEQP